MKALATTVVALLFFNAAQGQPLQTCYKSKWGPNDQIGALNNITAENVTAAARLVKRGKAILISNEEWVIAHSHHVIVRHQLLPVLEHSIPLLEHVVKRPRSKDRQIVMFLL